MQAGIVVRRKIFNSPSGRRIIYPVFPGANDEKKKCPGFRVASSPVGKGNGLNGMGSIKIILSGKFDPSGVQDIQIKIAHEEENPSEELQAIHQGLPRKGEVLLHGLDDVFQVIQLGADAILPFL